jgi:hypothetical protein
MMFCGFRSRCTRPRACEAHRLGGTLDDVDLSHRDAEAGAGIGLQQVRQRRALHLRHGVERRAVLEQAGLVHGDDARMIEAREDFGLGEEAVPGRRVGAQAVAELLDRHRPFQVDVLGLDDHGHAALAQHGAQAVAAA